MSPDEREAERQKQREALAAEEAAAKEARERGVVEPMLDAKAMQVIETIALLSVIAKKASKQVVKVTVFKDGKITAIEEPVGNEDDILREAIRQSGVFSKLGGGER